MKLPMFLPLGVICVVGLMSSCSGDDNVPIITPQWACRNGGRSAHAGIGCAHVAGSRAGKSSRLGTHPGTEAGPVV